MDYTSTILIVDDELGGRKTLEALLKAEGFNLIFAASGAEALDKAAEFAPDLVLLDVMMPGMDGFEVCRRLRADPFLAEMPVIMVTALDDRDSRLLGIEAVPTILCPSRLTATNCGRACARPRGSIVTAGCFWSAPSLSGSLSKPKKAM